MMYIRDEGENVRTGFNFYPLASSQFGFVFKLKDFVLFVRYNKQLGKFKCHRANIT